jgi:hypothetical protein
MEIEKFTFYLLDKVEKWVYYYSKPNIIVIQYEYYDI